MRAKLAMLAVVLAMGGSAKAGLSVDWYFSWGMYPNGAPDLTSVTPGTGVAAAQAVLWQLVYAGANGIADPVTGLTLGNPGYVGGDDVVVATRTTTAGGDANYDEWLYAGTGQPSYTNNTYSAGNYFIRVFQDTTPAVGDWYYDSPVIASVDQDLTGPFIPQSLDGNTDGLNQGDALNVQIIPEPGTAAMALLGLGLIGYRRLRKA